MIDEIPATFIDAALSRSRVTGLTHSFYRYPARFSPLFVRAAIKLFTKPGEMVFDPFMGGGTTLVEASALGRHAIGTDINSLSVFVSTVKTTIMNVRDLSELAAWGDSVVETLNLREHASRDFDWLQRGYQKNISGKKTWPIRKLLEMSLTRLHFLPTEKQQSFARCVLLRTAQWALDCRKDIPSTRSFRKQFSIYMGEMIEGANEYRKAIARAAKSKRFKRPACLHRSAVGAEMEPIFEREGRPRLILTSPPYPGVHVLYHRWQVQGRRETSAPYWIANSLDGDGSSFYTFGDRNQQALVDYFESAYAAFSSIAQIADRKATIIQVVAFSNSSWQLPKYLNTMERAGLREVRLWDMSTFDDGRLWRSVPNRKFYANQKGDTMSSNEVVLFHRRA